MADRVEIKGLPRFLRTMDRAADDLGDMKTAVAQTNALIATEASRRAPRRSGRLAASIEIGEDRNTAIIGSSLIYSAPIHWGWRTRGIDPNRFVLDAAEETQTQWEGLFRDDVEEAVGRVKGA